MSEGRLFRWHNHRRGSITWDVVSVGRVQAAVRAGKLDGSCVVTMKALRDAGLASKRIDAGIKLLADVRTRPARPSAARRAVV